jgi:hypothetical protein
MISRVCEYSWIKLTNDSVTALNQDAMFVCLQEFIVEEYFPLFVEHLSVAMSHQDAVRALATRIFNHKLLE